jgi:cyclopropane fatty-acyl-phospholipid synthase-like methyltransferase
MKCPSCSFVTAQCDPALEPKDLYLQDYFTGGEYLDYPADELFFKKTFRKRVKMLLSRQTSGRLLEIGSAYGFFLDLAKQYYDVVGYEVNKQAAQHARSCFGVKVHTDDFLGAQLDDIGEPVDLTVMWDVIEHLQQPDLYIKRIADFSRPGAMLYVTSGDIGSLVARLRGRKWRMIHPPTHLHYFSRATLARLLAKFGFEVIQIRSVGVARSFRQILYSILVLHLDMPGAYKRLARAVRPGWGLTINTFDIMLMTARKTD